MPPPSCSSPLYHVWSARPLCGLPVMQAWYAGLVCCKPVLGNVVVCCAWFRSRPVVLRAIPDGRDPDRTPVVEGVVPCGCGRRMRLPTRTTQAGAPNMPFQRRPLRVPKIVRFLKVRSTRRLSRSIGGGPAELFRSASGVRHCHAFLDVLWRIALLERPLCPLRRAQARGAGVVRRPVVLMARCAGCGRNARGAVRPFWAA